MIYLNNNTELQTVYIERNDGLGTPSHHSGSYESGYTDGVAYQKSLLSSITITDNGDYSRENGYSAITVNVPQTGTTSILGEGSFSANGTYSASTDNLDGYSAITIDVPTGISIDLSSITITANTAITETDKAYTGITVNVPQTGYTQQDLDNAYTSGYTSGETSIINTFTAITATTNGVYGSTGHPLSSITVNVPQTAITSDVKYVDYIEINTSGLVGTGSTHWIFTDNIGNQSRVTINFDFMPLASNASGMHKFINGPIYLRCDKPISNKKYNLKINGTYYRPWDGIVFSTDTRYNCYFSTETNVNNTAYVIINGNYFEVEYTDSASAARVMLNVSEPINQGETFRTTTGRYYGIKVTSGSTILVDARPALDNNNNPCFYDIISNSYIYHTGNSVPVAGNLLSLEEVFNRYYDYGYNTGYASGYTSGETNGYASGYSSGYTSGETVGYIDCSKNSIIGYRIREVLLSRIQSISSDTLTIFMDIILPYDDYAVFPFSYSASTEKYVELGYFQNYLRVEGNITNDEVDYYFTNPTPAEGRRVICQININPLINNRINVWLYDFVDGQGTYGVLSANSIINLNQLIRIQSCNFNELKIIKNGELIDDFRYNGNGKIVDVITGIEYGEDITPYNPYSSN